MSFKHYSIYPLCKAIFSIIGIGLGLLIVLIPFGMFSGAKSFTHPEVATYTTMPNAEFDATLLPAHTPVILHINIHEVIGTPKLNAKRMRQTLTGALSPALKNRIKGIILDINTPGGTAVDSEAIYQMLLDFKNELKVPLYAHSEGLLASGGMFIACACDKVYSGPTNIIGSVGVKLGPLFNFVEAMKKIGVSSYTMTEGLDKDLFNPFAPFEKEKLKSLEAIMEYDYNHFVDTVVKHRPRVNRDKLVNVYGARVFDPPKAKAIGYIDEVVLSYRDTLKALVEDAKVIGAYQVIKVKPREPVSEIFQDILGSKSKVIHSIDGYHSELAGRNLYLYE